jgi:hypothetical protein
MNSPIKLPMLDINTVGAGGGSIASVDSGGLLKVGPVAAYSARRLDIATEAEHHVSCHLNLLIAATHVARHGAHPSGIARDKLASDALRPH